MKMGVNPRPFAGFLQECLRDARQMNERGFLVGLSDAKRRNMPCDGIVLSGVSIAL